MLRINQFKRSTMAKVGSSLKTTRTTELSKVSLPENALIHYLTDTPADYGIRGSNLMIQKWEKEIRVCFMGDGYGGIGNPRYKKGGSTAKIRSYRVKQKRFRVQPNWERAIGSKGSLVVFDYSILASSYSYTANVRKFYNEWQNVSAAILAKVAAVGDRRSQFIQIKLPSYWPSYAEFNLVLDELSTSKLETWIDPGHFWLREIWLLIKRKGKLYDLVGNESLYFVISEGSNASFVSVGDLIERAGTEKKDNSVALGKSFYALCENLISSRTVTGVEVEEGDKFNTLVEKEVIAGVPNTTLEMINELADAGRLTPAEQKRLMTIAKKSDDLKNPYGGTQTVKEFTTITAKDLAIDDNLDLHVNKLTVPEHATKSATSSLRRDYVRRGLMDKHTLAMVNSLKRAGLLIQDFSVEDKIDAVEDAKTLKLKVVPVNGKVSTIAIDLPVIQEDSSFICSGVRYTLDMQKVDLPIRKVAYNRAALTSYFGKLFIQRSVIAKNDYNRWLSSSVRKAGLNSGDAKVTGIRFGSNKIPEVVLPREYTALTTTVTGFKSGNKEFYLDYFSREKYLGEKEVKAVEKKGLVACGRMNGVILTMDASGHINSGTEDLGHLMDVLGGGWGNVPTDVAELSLFGKRVPMGLVLGYYMGIDRLLKRINASYRTIASNIRSKAGMADDEMLIEFRDVSLYVKVTDPVVSLIMAGFNSQRGATRSFNMGDFDKKGVYGPILKGVGIEQYHIRELKLIRELFIDPITYDILVEMKEPTEILELMFKAVDLIKTDDAPDETDPRFMRRRGLERIPGFVYKTMISGIREQRNKPNPAIHPIYVGPRDAWMALIQDPTVQLARSLNPLHSLKEQEAVSLSGEGGRSTVSLVSKSRVFHKLDLGTFSESTPVSSKVGIRTYLSANAKTASLHGTYEPFDFKRDGSTSVLSTTSLVMPAMHNDDPKRMNLASAQQSAIVPAKGYQSFPLRTGGESVLSARLDEPFVYNADQDGEVVKITKSLLQIQYADGTKKGWKIGVFHGIADGESIPHNIVSDLTKGHKFLKGHVLAWNEGFFERDFFSPVNVVMKTGALSKTALMENNDTLEDGSRIAPSLQKLLETRTCKRKTILVRAEQIIGDLVKVGDVLSYDSLLCTIREGVTEGFEQTDTSLVALAKHTGSNPRAKYSGDVTRIEVFYMGDTEVMSDSLKAIVASDTARRTKDRKDTGARISNTGEIKRATYIAGEKVIAGTVAIVIYIDHDLEQGVGDKAVFGNQLKSIHGGIMTGTNRTEDGEDLDAFFGYRSANNRIVNSFVIQGALNLTLKALSAKMVEVYETGKA